MIYAELWMESLCFKKIKLMVKILLPVIFTNISTDYHKGH